MSSPREAAVELVKLGPLPDEKTDIADGVIERYEELLHSIPHPISRAEAEALVMLFLPNGCFGLDWSLLHLERISGLFMGLGVSSEDESVFT